MRLLSVLVLGSFVSSLGSGMTAFALGVWAFTAFGTASSVALLQLGAFAPIVLLSPAAGVLADRYDRRIMMVLGDGGSALGLLIVLAAVTHPAPSLALVLTGVTFSSCLACLTEPARRASVNELVDAEHYARASSLLQLASASKFLLSPVLAGALLPHGGVTAVLWVDVSTFAVTVTCTLVVRMATSGRAPRPTGDGAMRSLRRTVALLHEEPAVRTVIILTSLLTVDLGVLQVLFTPMLLPRFAVGQVGTAQSVAACGLLVGAAIVGGLGRVAPWMMLSAGLTLVGAGMVGLPLSDSPPALTACAFLVFAALACCNTGAEIVVRTRIADDHQGRAWGLISLVTQTGYLLAYAFAGPLADRVFEPLLLPDGALADGLGRLTGTGAGHGTALLVGLCGLGALTLIPLALSPRLRRVPAPGRADREAQVPAPQEEVNADVTAAPAARAR